MEKKICPICKTPDVEYQTNSDWDGFTIYCGKCSAFRMHKTEIDRRATGPADMDLSELIRAEAERRDAVASGYVYPVLLNGIIKPE